jgi:hypothetical protein
MATGQEMVSFVVGELFSGRSPRRKNLPRQPNPERASKTEFTMSDQHSDWQKSDSMKLALVQNDVNYIKQDMDEIKETIKELVTKVEFNPIKMTVYGLVGLIMAGVIGALIATVIIKP